MSTDEKPWTDQKYAKRIKRFFGLLLIRSFYRITEETNHKNDDMAALQLAYFRGMADMDATVISNREGMFAVADDQERQFWSLIYDYSVVKLASSRTTHPELLSVYSECAKLNVEIL